MAALSQAVPLLHTAVGEARRLAVEPTRLQQAEGVLAKASGVVELHDAARAKLTACNEEASKALIALREAGAQATKAHRRRLKQCVTEITDAITRADEGRVDSTLIREARRILAPARAAARFGISLEDVDMRDDELR